MVAAANEQHGKITLALRAEHGEHRHIHRNGGVAVFVRIILGEEFFQREAVFVSELFHSSPPLRRFTAASHIPPFISITYHAARVIYMI